MLFVLIIIVFMILGLMAFDDYEGREREKDKETYRRIVYDSRDTAKTTKFK